MSKILITGGCGFLGSNLAYDFLNSEDEVFILDSLYREGSKLNLEWLKSNIFSRNLKFFEIDIKDKLSVEQVFKENKTFDFIIHVAGQVAMTTSLKYPHLDFCTNALGTLNLLEATREYSPESLFAYSSTNKVYGDLKNLNYLEKEFRYEIEGFENGLNETIPLDFSTPYGCSKGAADQYVRDWSRSFGLKTTVFRHSSIYGGRQFATKDQGWIGWFCKQALNQALDLEGNRDVLPFTISGNGKQVRDVLHAKDLIQLYKKAFYNSEVVSGEIFNIGGGIENSLSILELFEILKEILKIKEIKYKQIERRKSDQDFFVADIKKVKNLLNWEPKIDVKNGLLNMIDWLKSG